MSNRLIKILSVLILAFSAITCTKREEAIVLPKYARAVVTTFTVDSLLFSVKLDNSLLVDSLMSPVASVLKQFSFYDTVVHVQVAEKNNWNRVIIDTNLSIHIGLNYINIVQLNSDEKPFLPAPPSEPLPDAGYCKVKFVYSAPPGVPFLDSVKCEILVDKSASGNGSAPSPVDTIVLSRYEFSEQYYVVKKSNASFRIKVYNPATNTLIQQTSFESTNSYLDFNTVNLSATKNASSIPIYNLVRVF